MMKRMNGLLVGVMALTLMGCGSTTEPVVQQTPSNVENEVAEDNSVEDNSVEEPKSDTLLTSAYASAQVGNTLTFGTYEQDNNLSNGQEPIQWEVIEVASDSIMVISSYVLDVHEGGFYQREDKTYSWENSDVRAWLNDEFYNTAFTEEEQMCIKETTVETNVAVERDHEAKRWSATGSSETTQDKIFLPSVFDDFPHISEVTEAVPEYEYNGMTGGSSIYPDDCWFRNPLAVYDIYGDSYESDHRESKDQHGIRPVMWLKTK